MTKYMILKSFIALFVIAGFSCGKKSDRQVIQKTPILENKNKNLSEKTKLDVNQKESSGSSTPSSVDITKAQKNDQEPQISEEEKSAVLKIKVLSQKKIDELLNQSQKVVFKSKIIDVEQAMKDLKKGNEDSFCSLAGDIAFSEQKMIAVIGVDKKLLDKDSDIFETAISLMSQNHKAILKCTHTTNNFYIEQFAINMNQYFEVWSDAKKMETANFKNPRTLNRTLNAVKIINLKVLQAASLSEDRKALVSGKLVSEEQSLDLIRNGKERTACIVSEVSKNLDTSKVYIRVDKLMGPDKYTDVIEQHTIYRADKDNYFVFQCMMTKKTSEWYDLVQVAQGVLKFGVLNRLEYNKLYDEVKAINDKVKSEP